MIGQLALVVTAWLLASSGQPLQPDQPDQPDQPSQPVAATDLDQFMARVLARRDDNWRKLQQYILDEREQADLLGPGGVRLYGLVRDYTWYVRDGVFVRSPVKFDGVALSEEERRKYEDEWLAREKARDERKASEAARPETKSEVPATEGAPGADDVAALMRLSKEPQFVSAAYFLKFKFEQGRYAFAGPEMYDGRRVLKIEYYPTRLFSGDKRDNSSAGSDAPPQDAEKKKEQDLERRLERQFNKVAMVTLWVEPEAHQIVKYVFENIGMDFLPGRWFVRVEDVAATMEMGQAFPGVWLPRHIDGQGKATLANGTYAVQYRVDYRDYREATTKATIR
jgi:hypothetical protein